MDLKLFRKVNKITQGELGDLFGCSVGHISNIESGNRSITGLQIRLLIDKYGFEAVSKYADPSELPATGPVVAIDMSKGHTEITGNHGPVNSGSGTQTTADSGLVETMKMQAEVLSNQSQQITSLITQQNALIQQQAELIALLKQK